MLVDIFSSFDDHNFVFLDYYPLIWGVMILSISIFSLYFWSLSSRWSFFFNSIIAVISSELMRVRGGVIRGFIHLTLTLFIFIIFINLLGLVPYTFSLTTHLVVSLTIGLPMWLAIVCASIINNVNIVIASLLPGGAPSLLNPFLVLVETLSLLVRPVTLAIRLMANISAGHIIMTLISKSTIAAIFCLPVTFLFSLSFMQIFYTVFEIAICVIQSYIFCLLIGLYTNDHP